MKKSAIIVAGGSGRRMGASVPKQFLEIGGRPILIRTLERFCEYDPNIELIVVLPERDLPRWQSLCSQFAVAVSHQVVSGGDSRFQSVKNGLKALESTSGLVAIHDGVRPFVSLEVIGMSYEVAKQKGSAIPVIPLKDSIRRLEEGGTSMAQDRQLFRLVQTPQTFQTERILSAFDSEEQPFFTDDATVYEHMGWQVSLIAGNSENIKITTREDMDFAKYLITRHNYR